MNSRARYLLKTLTIVLVGGLAVLSESWRLAAGFHAPLQRLVAQGTSGFLQLFGFPIYLDESTVHSLNYSVSVIPSCDGLAPAAIVLTGVALLSVSRVQKLRLALLGVVAVYVMNVLRIATVLGVGTRSAEGAHVAHEIVFPALWLLVFGVLWLVWLRREEPRAPSEVHP